MPVRMIHSCTGPVGTSPSFSFFVRPCFLILFLVSTLLGVPRAESTPTGLPPPRSIEIGRALMDARTYRLAMDRFMEVQEGSSGLPEKAQALARVGEARMRNGDYAAAYDAFRSSLRLAPLALSSPDLEFRSAVALVHLKSHRTALYEFERYETRHPSSPLLADVRFWKGEALYQLEDYKAAQAEYDAIVRDHPGYPYLDLVRYLRAWCSFRLDDLDPAWSGFSKVSSDAQDPRLRRLAAFQAAETLFRRAEYAKASAAYGDYLKENPGDDLVPAALYGLGWSLEKEGKSAKALESYARIVESHGSHPLAPWASVRRGALHQARGAKKEAREAYETALRLSENRPPADLALYGLGWIDYTGDDFDSALGRFESVAAFTPPSPVHWDARFLAGGCLYRQARYPEAKEAYLRVGEKAPDEMRWAAAYWAGWCDLASNEPGKALVTFRDLADSIGAANAWKSRSLWALGEAAYRFGDLKRALNAYESALEIPKSPVAAESHNGAGWSLFGLARYEESLRHFQETLRMAPRSELAPEARLRSGDCLYNLRRYEEARVQYEKVPKEPDPIAWMDAREQLGWCHFRQEQFGKARAAWEDLLADAGATDRRVRLTYWSAWSHFRSKDFDGAARIFGKVVELAPDDALAAEASLRKADSQYNGKRFKDAVDSYDAFIRTYPGHPLVPDALYGLQWSYEKLGLQEEALGAARRFLEQYPESEYAADVQYRLAESLYHAKKYQAAIDEFQKMAGKYPDSPNAPRAQFWTATALSNMGRTEEAAEGFRTLLRKWPGDPLALEARFSLGSVLFQKKDFSKARVEFRKVFEDFPKHRLAPHALFNAAVCEKEMGHPRDALVYFQRIRKEFPGDPLSDEASLQAGILLESVGRLEEALGAYAQARELKNPKLSVEATFYHADLLKRMKRYDAAVKEFNRLTVRYPKEGEWCVTAMAKVAEIHEEQGKYSKAADEYRRILRYTGVKTWRDAAQKRLKALEPYLRSSATPTGTSPAPKEARP